MSEKYVSFHNHTEQGSHLDAIIKPKQLLQDLVDTGGDTIAISEHGNMISTYDLVKHADGMKSQDGKPIKVIPGIEIYFNPNNKNPEAEDYRKNYHLVLSAKNKRGYENLLQLQYEAHHTQSYGFMGKATPRVGWEELKRLSYDVFCSTACSNGIIGKTLIEKDDEAGAIQHIKHLHSIFGDRLSLEIQPHALLATSHKTGKVTADQRKLNQWLIKQSHEFGIPYLIASDAHYGREGGAQAHDVLLAIKDHKAVSDPDRFKYGIDNLYLDSTSEIIEYFGRDIALPAIRRSAEIAAACEFPHYAKPSGPILPRFDMTGEPDFEPFNKWRLEACPDIPMDHAYLRWVAMNNFKKRFLKFSLDKKKHYWERLNKEIRVLEQKNFSSYILIVSDYVKWAKQHMPVGPGRGSGSGGLISYLTDITNIDPIKYGLFFERFINLKKKDFPDYDVDFSRPALVKKYLEQKYGEEYVASISNWSTLTPKVIVKDVSRSLRIGPGETDNERKGSSFRIANNITSDMGDEKTIEDEYIKNKKFARSMNEYPEVFKYSKSLQNNVRNMGVHAAGVVIGTQPLKRTIPLRIEKKKGKSTSVVATQWEKKRVEAFGLVKMDLLGLKTLTIIDSAIQLIKSRTGDVVIMDNIPLDDKNVYDMIGRGETSGVFQLESSLTPLCMKLKPKDIEGISVVNAIGRPSCQADSREEYIECALGNREPKYVHPSTKGALEQTYGVLVYEEQAMLLALQCAGWDLNEADALRKLSKLKGKDPELALRTEQNFKRDCMKHSGFTKTQAETLWRDYLEPLSKYSFNKAHSIAYSHISYYTAWLRYHYPTEFLCAMLNVEDPNSDSAQFYISESKSMGVQILPPSVNSSMNYAIEDTGVIRTGINAIKGVGDKAAENILENKPYVNLRTFFAKTNSRVVSKTVIQALDKSGSFDSFEIPRGVIHENYAAMRTKVTSLLNKKRKAWEKEYLSGIEDKDDHPDKETLKELSADWILKNKLALVSDMAPLYDEDKDYESWDRAKILMAEQQSLGRTISGSMHDAFSSFFRGGSKMATRLSTVENLNKKQKIRIEAIIKSKIKEFTIKKETSPRKGQKFAKYLVEDRYGSTISMTVWTEDYSLYKSKFVDGTPIKAICSVNEFAGKKDIALVSVERLWTAK